MLKLQDCIKVTLMTSVRRIILIFLLVLSIAFFASATLLYAADAIVIVEGPQMIQIPNVPNLTCDNRVVLNGVAPKQSQIFVNGALTTSTGNVNSFSLTLDLTYGINTFNIYSVKDGTHSTTTTYAIDRPPLCLGDSVVPLDLNVFASEVRTWSDIDQNFTYVMVPGDPNNYNLKYETVTGVTADGTAVPFHVDNTPVQRIETKLTSNIDKMDIRVSTFKQRPTSVFEAENPIYSYFSIKAGPFTEPDIDWGAIEFTVPKTWVANNEVGLENITLYKNEPTGWVEIPTFMNGENALIYSYRAELNILLGEFAIALTPPSQPVMNDITTCNTRHLFSGEADKGVRVFVGDFEKTQADMSAGTYQFKHDLDFGENILPLKTRSFNTFSDIQPITVTKDPYCFGGSIVPLEDFETKMDIRAWPEITANSLHEFEVDVADHPIKRIAIVPTVTRENVDIRTTVRMTPPDIQVEDPVYQYLRIEKAQITNEEISDADVEFKVEKSWLESQNADVRDVVLRRYTTEWDELTTTIDSSDGTYHYFIAETPGFSEFAISIKGGGGSGGSGGGSGPSGSTVAVGGSGSSTKSLEELKDRVTGSDVISYADEAIHVKDVTKPIDDTHTEIISPDGVLTIEPDDSMPATIETEPTKKSYEDIDEDGVSDVIKKIVGLDTHTPDTDDGVPDSDREFFVKLYPQANEEGHDLCLKADGDRELEPLTQCAEGSDQKRLVLTRINTRSIYEKQGDRYVRRKLLFTFDRTPHIYGESADNMLIVAHLNKRNRVIDKIVSLSDENGYFEVVPHHGIPSIFGISQLEIDAYGFQKGTIDGLDRVKYWFIDIPMIVFDLLVLFLCGRLIKRLRKTREKRKK